MTTLRIATRRSELAIAQAGIVRMLLTAQGFDVVLIPLSTSGDEDAPRADGDGKDRWIDAILDALRSGAAAVSEDPERAAEIVATQLRRGGAEAILDAIRQP